MLINKLCLVSDNIETYAVMFASFKERFLSFPDVIFVFIIFYLALHTLTFICLYSHSYLQQEGLLEITEDYVEENSTERESESGRFLPLVVFCQ